jgi:hypothetical protein
MNLLAYLRTRTIGRPTENAGLILDLRRDVAQGAGHDCEEWVVGARCILCDRPRERPREPVPSITCPVCQRTSYNVNDIRERYCGFCHRFHADMQTSVR